MDQNILHVGLDVDDTRYHGSAFNKETGEVIDFRCRSVLRVLLTQPGLNVPFGPNSLIERSITLFSGW